MDTVIGDPQPSFNDCSTRETMQMTGRNVGALLTEQGIMWGGFQGGFTVQTLNRLEQLPHLEEAMHSIACVDVVGDVVADVKRSIRQIRGKAGVEPSGEPDAANRQQVIGVGPQPWLHQLRVGH